jgi:cyclopropane-fatty-acyl-phospholipid synthase
VEFYLLLAETAFLWENIAVFQVQLVHRQTAVPLTRDYLREAEDALRKAERDSA